MRINKVFLVLGVVVLLILSSLTGCSAAGVSGADIQPASVNINGQQGIWVTGQGKVTIVPNIVDLYIGIMAQSDKVADAQSQASAAMDKLMAALTNSGIDKKDIQTQSYNIQQLTRYDNTNNQPTITGYQVTNMLDVKIRAMDKVGSIINNAVTAGGDLVRINGIYLWVENPNQFYAQARDQAMQDARTKAEDIARLSGVTLGKVTYISESASSPSPPPTAIYGGAMMAVPAPAIMPYISPGQSDINLYVQVNYAIQ